MNVGLRCGRAVCQRQQSNLLRPIGSVSRLASTSSVERGIGAGWRYTQSRPFSKGITHHARNQASQPQHVRRPPANAQATPYEHVEVRPEDFVNQVFPDPKEPQIVAPLIYTILFGVGTYFVAVMVSVKQTEEATQAIEADRKPFGKLTSYLSIHDDRIPDGRKEAQLDAFQQHKSAERIGRAIQGVMGFFNALGFSKKSKEEVAGHLTDMAEWYLNLPLGQQVVVPTIAAVGGVFVVLNVGFALKNVELRKALFRWTMHVPVSRYHVALTTSVLAHIGFLHLALNSYGLWNFDGSSLRAPRFLQDSNGKMQHTAEASLLPHYVAFFLISGTFASLCSHAEARLLFRMIQRRSGTPKAMRTIGMIPSLGSSGAAYALVTNWALAHRDEGLMGIIFLPKSWMKKPLEMLTYVLSAEMIITVLGLLRGRHLTRVGHVAHLGGALFGWLYYRYGNAVWEQSKAFVRTSLRFEQRKPAPASIRI